MNTSRLALLGPELPDRRGNPEPLLTAAEVARILGVRPKRVYELGIPAVRISEKSLRWRPSQVASWIQQREGVA
ncbi:MAG: helix-turn-helix transcriptional regulator [Gemmatimonadales bacterium]